MSIRMSAKAAEKSASMSYGRKISGPSLLDLSVETFLASRR